MGSRFNLILYTEDSITAAKAASDSFSLVDSLVNIFSDYLDSSEVNRLCATAGYHSDFIPLSPPLYELIQLSKSAYEKK